MTHHNRFDRIVAFLLVLTLCCSLLPPSAVIASDNDTIVLRSAKDLEKLSRSCALDTWSQGKTVILENDINLNGTDFAPIPTFGGTFEGNGYTISGLHISGGTACHRSSSASLTHSSASASDPVIRPARLCKSCPYLQDTASSACSSWAYSLSLILSSSQINSVTGNSFLRV